MPSERGTERGTDTKADSEEDRMRHRKKKKEALSFPLRSRLTEVGSNRSMCGSVEAGLRVQRDELWELPFS